MSNDVRRWRPWWQPEGLRVSEDCVGEYVLYGEHQSALAALREELADERLAFNHANEIAGKYEAENAALKSTLDHAKIHWQACAKDSEMVRGLLDAERDTTVALKARLERIRIETIKESIQTMCPNCPGPERDHGIGDYFSHCPVPQLWRLLRKDCTHANRTTHPATSDIWTCNDCGAKEPSK